MKKHYTDIFLDLDRTLWDFDTHNTTGNYGVYTATGKLPKTI